MPRLRLGRFAPGLVPTLLVLPLLLGLVWLGDWQLDRAAEKQALWDAFARGSDAAIALPKPATPPRRYSHVEVAGRYLSARQFLLDNMVHDGAPGYRVLTPLERLDG